MRVYWVMGYARTHRRSVDGNSERRALRALGVNRSLKLYVAVAAGHRNRVFASESPNTPHPNRGEGRGRKGAEHAHEEGGARPRCGFRPRPAGQADQFSRGHLGEPSPLGLRWRGPARRRISLFAYTLQALSAPCRQAFSQRTHAILVYLLAPSITIVCSGHVNARMHIAQALSDFHHGERCCCSDHGPSINQSRAKLRCPIAVESCTLRSIKAQTGISCHAMLYLPLNSRVAQVTMHL